MKLSKKLNIFKLLRRFPSTNIINFQDQPTISLVVAVYNVELYLDDFMQSVIDQSISLKGLQVILVNDGSTDQSGTIIEGWATRYPSVFQCIHQENQGVAAARNAGMLKATGDWISFPDSDDFFDLDYLKHVKSAIIEQRENNPMLIVANMHRYFEDLCEFKNNHPLKYRFDTGITAIKSSRLNKHILLATNHLFFLRTSIQEHKLQFDTMVRPAFEDAHFVNRLCLLEPEKTVTFVPEAIYYYRKRAEKTSLIDGTTVDVRWYTDQIEFGYLPLLELSRKLNKKIPTFIQNAVMYSVMWKLRYLVNHSYKINFMSDDERQHFLNLLEKLFSGIDEKTIQRFGLAGCTEGHKTALLMRYKSARRPIIRVYLVAHDIVNAKFQFSWITGGDDYFDLDPTVNGKPVEMFDRSTVTNDFLGEPYNRKHYAWVNLEAGDELKFTANGNSTRMRHRGKAIGKVANYEQLVKFLPPAPYSSWLASEDEKERRRYIVLPETREQYKDCWVIMDRDTDADDNAEHFYRYLMSIDRVDKAYFILSKESSDWTRLEAEGFKLIDAFSDDHIAALAHSKYLISSHVNNYVLWPETRATYNDLVNYQFIFLQHGITQHNLSGWLNPKRIQIFVTSTSDEHRSISAPDSPYIYTNKETKLTGFPRHDALLKKKTTGDTILIMPTWRDSLVDETNRKGDHRNSVSHFSESEFAKNWMAVLHSTRIKDLAEEHGVSITFAPHPIMKMYVDELKLPAFVELFDTCKHGSLQSVFARTKVLLTDYSSVAFDVAYLETPVVYFHFAAEVASDSNGAAKAEIKKPGYFDFKRDGFGPVVETPEQVMDALEAALRGQQDPAYLQRVQDTFAHRDGRCCERVYTAIRALEVPA